MGNPQVNLFKPLCSDKIRWENGKKEGELLSQCGACFVAFNHLGAELNRVITVLCKHLKRLKMMLQLNHSSQKSDSP